MDDRFLPQWRTSVTDDIRGLPDRLHPTVAEIARIFAQVRGRDVTHIYVMIADGEGETEVMRFEIEAT